MMKRVLIPLVVAAGLLGPPAHAAATEERIVSELREQGFTRVEIRRTLLGRTRIVATSPTYEREIILNPSSGVILRDFWTVRGEVGNEAPSRIVGGPNLRDGGSGSRATSGSSGGDSDDDDSSGSSSGSGSSGSSSSGSSGSGSDDADDDDDDDSSSGGDDSDDDDDDDDDSGSGSDDSDDDDDDDD